MKTQLVFLAFSLIAYATNAQADLVKQDYARAESMLSYNTGKYVDYESVRPNWFDGDKFWYRSRTSNGSEFSVVDPSRRKKSPAFDHDKLAQSIMKATGLKCTASTLPFLSFSYVGDGKSIYFETGGKYWNCNLQSYNMEEVKKNPDAEKKNPRGTPKEVVAPDGKRAVFIKDYNLFLKDLSTGNVKQLTADGEKYFGYATDNAGWIQSDGPVVTWSPDSRKIATFQQDERKVGEMYLVTTNVGHPTLKQWKYPLPGDENIPMIHRVIIEVEGPRVIRLDMPPDPHRASLGDDISVTGGLDDVEWTEDGSELAFLSTSRDHKIENFRIANAGTGKVRDVFTETVGTQYESGRDAINWRYLQKSNEIIWYSERDDWGHLYLYDAANGVLKNQITTGKWLVAQVLSVDEKSRTIYFMAAGVQEENPYYLSMYKIGFDGKKLTPLTPEAGYHQIEFSPSGNYFIDTYSKSDVPPVMVLRDMSGKILVELEKTDVSRLRATGWKPPTLLKLKAKDGETDIYGLMFTPTNLDVTKRYPIVDYIYPGPQGGSVGNWKFVPSMRDHQALAELGFVVVAIEGTSNPYRSKSYHDMSYGNMSENTIPDQIAAIRQLANTYPYIDINRVGIWGHSGGGFATATAMFRYPDFFKVGIAESGNHDNRNYEDDWGERYNGLLVKDGEGSDNYESQANQVYAENLKGKLMLAHGMMDDNVPPYNTMLVIEALEKANKDYDLVIFPNARHGFGEFSDYMMRKRWDYFVKNLLGVDPPKEYKFEKKADPRDVTH